MRADYVANDVSRPNARFLDARAGRSYTGAASVLARMPRG
jgi:hypothetical protein